MQVLLADTVLLGVPVVVLVRSVIMLVMLLVVVLDVSLVRVKLASVVVGEIEVADVLCVAPVRLGMSI